jgi:general secretion pathway protein A
MYREFYGLAEEPFTLDPDPRFLYLTPTHFAAYSSVMSGIMDRKGIILITGEVGTGKTLVIHALLKDLGDWIKTAFVFHPGLSLKDLLKEILLQLDVPVWEREQNLAYFLIAFKGYLHERLARGETVAVVIDEAQNLDEEALEGLGRFCDSETPAGGVLQILLVGHPELEAKLGSGILSLFKQKIKVHCRIAPLDREEAKRYIEHRLKVAGRNCSGTFTPDAADRIWEFAQGVPRVINLVCDQALLAGFKKSSSVIDSKIAREAMKGLDYLRPTGLLQRMLSFKKSGHKIFRIFLLLLSLVFFIFSLRKLLAMLLHR